MSKAIQAQARSWRGLALALGIATSCSSPGGSSAQAGLQIVAHTTFLHAGFGAGPAVFTGDTGHLVEERRFEPFGAAVDARVHESAGDVTGPPDLVDRDLNEMNKRTDTSTGWSDHGARWMAPETGRWLAPDPPVAGPDARFMQAPWSLHPYQYADSNPIAYWDPDGKCSAPILGPGQVGICIEAYISTSYGKQILGFFPLGGGDDRGPDGNDPSKSSRLQQQITIDLQTGKIVNRTDVANSQAIGIERKATGSTRLDSFAVDAANNISFTAGGHGVNGFTGLPGAPKGSIDYKFRLNVDAEGDTTLLWGIHKGFPSYGVYAYRPDGQGGVTTTALHESKQRAIADLQTLFDGLGPFNDDPGPNAGKDGVKVLTSDDSPVE